MLEEDWKMDITQIHTLKSRRKRWGFQLILAEKTEQELGTRPGGCTNQWSWPCRQLETLSSEKTEPKKISKTIQQNWMSKHQKRNQCFHLCRDGSYAWTSKSGRSKCSEPEAAAQKQQRIDFEWMSTPMMNEWMMSWELALEHTLAGSFCAPAKGWRQDFVQLKGRASMEMAQCCLEAGQRPGSLFQKPYFSGCLLSQDMVLEKIIAQ